MRRAIWIFALVLVLSVLDYRQFLPVEKPDPAKLQRCLMEMGRNLGPQGERRCALVALAMARLGVYWQRAMDSGHVFLARCRGEGWKLVKISGGPVAVGLASQGAFVQVNFTWAHASNAHSPGADVYGDLQQPSRGPSCFRDPQRAMQFDRPGDFSTDLPTLPIFVLSGSSTISTFSVRQGALLLYDIEKRNLVLQEPEQLLRPPFWTTDKAGSTFDSTFLDRLRSVWVLEP